VLEFLERVDQQQPRFTDHDVISGRVKKINYSMRADRRKTGCGRTGVYIAAPDVCRDRVVAHG